MGFYYDVQWWAEPTAAWCRNKPGRIDKKSAFARRQTLINFARKSFLFSKCVGESNWKTLSDESVIKIGVDKKKRVMGSTLSPVCMPSTPFIRHPQPSHFKNWASLKPVWINFQFSKNVIINFIARAVFRVLNWADSIIWWRYNSALSVCTGGGGWSE